MCCSVRTALSMLPKTQVLQSQWLRPISRAWHCLEDGEVLVDAAASVSDDPQATLVLPEAHASGPSRFSLTQEGRSGTQHRVTPDFSQRGQSAQGSPIIQGRNSTAWILGYFGDSWACRYHRLLPVAQS